MNKFNDNIWNDYLGKKLLLVAMSLVLLTHAVIIYFTLPKTYDAFVHMFFADHYARFWFEPWDYRWYTGFFTISYPPLVHQLIALLSKLFPLKVAFSISAILIFELLVIGVYRFTKLFFDKRIAGVAALISVVLSSIIETLHVYGQLPTLTGLAFLLNALPFLYLYLLDKKLINLVMAMALLSVAICSHHVTAIFGMVFFIAPTVFMSLVDSLPKSDQQKSYLAISSPIIKKALKNYKHFIALAFLMILLSIVLIFPYWYWSKTDPITQVSIPHGSRDNFILNPQSGLIFYIIPLALVLAFLPAIFYAIGKQKRLFGWMVSLLLCLLLGSGGTTPLPRWILGDHVFSILTLDRFTFWASIISIPFIAKFVYSFIAGSVKDFWIARMGASYHFMLSGLSGFSYLLFIIYIFHLASFRPLQPKEIDIQPLLNFLNRDDHMRWRYLTLGFGDQIAWLSANSLAATVDGNYHSARRLPELTSRPVERLENAKFMGDEGLASLSDFLIKAEKYSLKYVFNNDRYYDPLLYYTGWTRTIRLENGIMVWEKGNISNIGPIAPPPLSPFLKLAWGIVPLSILGITVLLTLFYLWKYKRKDYLGLMPNADVRYTPKVIYSSSLLPIIFFSSFMLKQVAELLFVQEQRDPETTVINYYNHLDFQRFEKAFQFFKPLPTFPIDQYFLEQSITDGGLLPSYAKLDSIHAEEIYRTNDTAIVKVYTKWRTALGHRQEVDTFMLQQNRGKWNILQQPFTYEIPEEQMRSYTFTLFKKVGKRLISSFPTVKDDRVKRPFVSVKQANFVRNAKENFITGSLINADNIPVNIALKVTVHYHNDSIEIYYPGTDFQYNISPKATSFFQVPLGESSRMDSSVVRSVDVHVQADVSDRGYIHGGTPGYAVETKNENEVIINTSLYNELTTKIAIPGILITEKDTNGLIWQTQLALHDKSVRSGLNINFKSSFKKIQDTASMIRDIPVQIFVNGQKRQLHEAVKIDQLSIANNGITIIPHCFVAEEIYLH